MTTKTTLPHANARKTPNEFLWADLSSTDDAAADKFYSRVFGWAWQEMPLGETMVHRDAQLGGHLIAGLDPVMPGSGQPTAWTNFVAVTDIDKTVAAVKHLGGSVAMPPMDVMGAGHMAVLMDPAGAAFGLWQPGTHTGADAVNQPGTSTWFELATDDVAGARKFYSELFGWEWDRIEGSDMEYWTAKLNGAPAFAGLMAKPAEMGEMPNFWAAYFGVADVDAAAGEIQAAGGTVVAGPMRMGPGKGVCVLDPQGGYFVAYQMDEWPVA